MKKKTYFAAFKSLKKGVGSGLDPDADPLVRETNPGIRIRTKISQISNTALDPILPSTHLHAFHSPNI
jgi:hypothetical protein